MAEMRSVVSVESLVGVRQGIERLTCGIFMDSYQTKSNKHYSLDFIPPHDFSFLIHPTSHKLSNLELPAVLHSVQFMLQLVENSVYVDAQCKSSRARLGLIVAFKKQSLSVGGIITNRQSMFCRLRCLQSSQYFNNSFSKSLSFT